MSSKCKIYNSTFFDDLYPFIIDGSNLIYKINNDTTQPVPLNNRISIGAFALDPTQYWKPAIIDNTNSRIDHKLILGKTQVKTPVLGIEDAVSFAPFFRNWNVMSVDEPIMSCNWFISSMSGGIIPEYGVLFWYKAKTPMSTKYIDFPDGTILYTKRDIRNSTGRIVFLKNTRLNKISNTHVLVLVGNRNVFDDDEKISDISDVPDLINSTDAVSLSNNPILSNDTECDLWIPDGECFSYFNNSIEKDRYNKSSIVSHTYLSPGLFPAYRSIYHRLTRFKPRGFPYSRKEAALLQKLCFFLSTAPQIDGTTIDMLLHDDIVSDLSNDLRTASIRSIDEDKEKILSMINNIMEKYVNMTTFTHKNTIMDNYASDLGSLYHKILKKYGAVLRVDPDKDIIISKKEKISNHALISIGAVHTYPTNISNNVVLYNNSSIKLGDIEYSSNMSANQSSLLLKATSGKTCAIPLADFDIPQTKVTELSVNGGVINYTFAPGSSNDGGRDEVVIPLNMLFGSDVEGASYNWELYSGPSCLRFSDSSKDAKNIFGNPIFPPIKRFTSSTDSNPLVFIKQPGEYEIKVTQTLYRNITQSAIITLTNSSSSIEGSDAAPQSYSFNKILCSSLKSIAFNKYGLLWLLDTDHYYDTGFGTENDDYGIYGVLRLKDVSLNVSPSNKLDIALNTANDLTLKYSGGTAGAWLMSIDIEHMRDDDKKYSNCKSFYREKIARKVDRINQPILGAADFYRASPGSYTFTARASNPGIESITFNDPPISTDYAPQVYFYGGYDEKTVNKIGINIPYHTSPKQDDKCLISLTAIHERNNFYQIPNDPKYCFLQEVAPVGDHTVTMQPGHFHPAYGWQNNNIGKSAVISNKPGRQESLIFKGGGFFDMKPGGIYSSNIYIRRTNTPGDNIVKNVYGMFGKDSTNITNYSNRNFFVSDDNSWSTSDSFDSIGPDNICGSQYTLYETDDITVGGTIGSIEIKLNFLNYYNPKNLRIWLDIPGANISTKATKISGRDYNNLRQNELKGSLSNYINSIIRSPSDGITLLNEEHIHNYKNNFSITFSDYANKYTTTTKYNTNLNYIPYKQKLLYDNDKIMPSIKPQGYSDYFCELFEPLLKINNINKVENNKILYKLSAFDPVISLFNNFRLNIQVINYLHHDGKILDNLLYNDIMTGNRSTENHLSSNTLLNSLCSWELIINLRDIPNTNRSNIDYPLINCLVGQNRYEPSEGYDYIGDFKDCKFLLPLVNINAPHPYLANINSCSYTDENLSKNILAPKPEFPSLLPYLMAGTGFAFGTIIGGLTALYALDRFYGNGGRNDPIVNYFIETRLLNQTQTVDGQYYKPVYTRQYFGQADRAIVALTQDEVYWYGIEVPIFRYINTPAMENNRYRYVNLNNVDGLSKIPFQTVSSVDNLNLSFTNDIGPSGLSFYNIQTLPLDTGVLKDNKHIITDGSRPFYLFGKGNTVNISSMPDSVTISIVNTCLLSTIDGTKTLIELSEPVTSPGNISRSDDSTILVYRPDQTLIIDNQKYFSKWSMDKSYDQITTQQFIDKYNTTYSVGSIGWGTSQVNPDILYQWSENKNNISISELLNNKISDKYINNELYFTDIEDTEIINTFTGGGVFGWATTLEDLHVNNYNNSIPKITGISVPDTHTYSYDNSPVFIELTHPSFGALPSSGYLRVQNDWYRNDKINLSGGDIEKLKNKLKELQSSIPIPATGTYYNTIKNINYISSILEKSVIGNGYYNGKLNGDTVSVEDIKYKYWIHIDPSQPCILLDELTFKIPTKTEITAVPIVGDLNIDQSQIIPSKRTDVSTDTADWFIKTIGIKYSYEKSGPKLYKDATEAAAALGLTWENPETNNELFIYGDNDPASGDSKKMLIGLGTSVVDNLIAIRESYIRLPGTKNKDNQTIGSVLNLDKPIKMKFRNIPRHLKSIDSESFDKYSYDRRSNLIKGSGANGLARSVGQLANNFVCWHCIDKYGKLTEPTTFFKMMNEMYYRAFFGSMDRIEHKTEYMDSQDAWEWIPYEYFTAPCKAEEEYKPPRSVGGRGPTVLQVGVAGIHIPETGRKETTIINHLDNTTENLPDEKIYITPENIKFKKWTRFVDIKYAGSETVPTRINEYTIDCVAETGVPVTENNIQDENILDKKGYLIQINTKYEWDGTGQDKKLKTTITEETWIDTVTVISTYSPPTSHQYEHRAYIKGDPGKEIRYDRVPEDRNRPIESDTSLREYGPSESPGYLATNTSYDEDGYPTVVTKRFLLAGAIVDPGTAQTIYAGSDDPIDGRYFAKAGPGGCPTQEPEDPRDRPGIDILITAESATSCETGPCSEEDLVSYTRVRVTQSEGESIPVGLSNKLKNPTMRIYLYDCECLDEFKAYIKRPDCSS